MQVFVNEKSLHEQYHNLQDFENSIRAFTSTLFLLKNEKLDYTTYIDRNNISQCHAIKNENYYSNLNHIDKFIRQAFINILFNKNNAKHY